MGVTHSIKMLHKPSLRAALAAPYHVDLDDQLIAAVNEDNYSTVFSLLPIAFAVLRVAAQVEPDPALAMHWYRQTRIAGLGHLTAAELVATGRSQAVIDFLQGIRDGQRD